MNEIEKRKETLPETLERIKQAIEKIETIEEAKELSDKAEVIRAYVKKTKMGLEIQNHAAEVKIRVERKGGKLINENPDIHPGGDRKSSLHDERMKLKDYGITEIQSHRWQAFSGIKNKEFESKIKKILDDKMELTSASIYNFAIKLKKKRKQDEIILPEGQYNTIIIDPDWPIDKIHRDKIPQGKDLDYFGHRTSLDAIRKFKIPASENCHLFLWTTQKYLPISFEVLKEWGFKYIFTMVWCKTGGFQPFNLPQYNCEFVVYGRIGTPKFLETKAFFTCFHGKRREHSRKPKEFYDLIRRVCPEPRIDIFSREQIEGFECWGDENEKF